MLPDWPISAFNGAVLVRGAPSHLDIEASAAEMAKMSKGNNAPQVGSAFVRDQVNGYREMLQEQATKKDLLERGGRVTTGAPRPAVRGGNRRKGSTCASKGGRDDEEPRKTAPELVPGGQTQALEEPLQIASGKVRTRGRLTRRMAIRCKNGGDPLRQMKVIHSLEQMNHVVEEGDGRPA